MSGEWQLQRQINFRFNKIPLPSKLLCRHCLVTSNLEDNGCGRPTIRFHTRVRIFLRCKFSWNNTYSPCDSPSNTIIFEPEQTTQNGYWLATVTSGKQMFLTHNSQLIYWYSNEKFIIIWQQRKACITQPVRKTHNAVSETISKANRLQQLSSKQSLTET